MSPGLTVVRSPHSLSEWRSYTRAEALRLAHLLSLKSSAIGDANVSGCGRRVTNSPKGLPRDARTPLSLAIRMWIWIDDARIRRGDQEVLQAAQGCGQRFPVPEYGYLSPQFPEAPVCVASCMGADCREVHAGRWDIPGNCRLQFHDDHPHDHTVWRCQYTHLLEPMIRLEY